MVRDSAVDIRENACIGWQDSINCRSTVFPLADIQSCQIKNGWMGSVKCAVTMKNGSHCKLLLPKLGGLGGGMPHHAEYRAAILARLERFS